MLIESACYQLLKHESIVSLVGGRIFGGVLPEEKDKPYDDYPVIVYRPPSDGGRRVVRVLEGGCPLIEQKIHIFSAAKKKMGQAARIDEAIFQRLDEFKGIVTDPTTSPVESIDVQAVLQTDLAHAYAFIDDLKVHQFLTEYLFHYKDPMRGTPKYV